MAIRTWTIEATGIEYKSIDLNYKDGVLYWRRGYYFVDQNGEPIRRIVDDVVFDIGESMSGSILWDDIPQDIKDALVTIDSYTKSQINQKEGIE